MPTKRAQDAAPKAKAKGPGGRPTDYTPKHAEQARKLCQLGATDADLADFFGVAVSTVARWKVMNPEFSDALKLGKEQADERVVNSLYHRATGYSHPEVDIRVVDGQIVKTELIKHYPPDTTAAIFWLKNRRKDEWRDKQEVAHDIAEDSPMAALLKQVSGATIKPGGGQ